MITLTFDSIAENIQAGEALEIRGANGSGKSTLLRTIAGFIEPQEGSVRWEGQCTLKHRDSYQKKLHYIGHKPGMRSSLTVLENLSLFCALKKINPTQKHLDEVMEKMGLIQFNYKITSTLSAGQQQRLALARLLLYPQPIWILDEPGTALDQAGEKLLKNLLENQLAQKGIVIMATHQPTLLNFSVKTINL